MWLQYWLFSTIMPTDWGAYLTSSTAWPAFTVSLRVTTTTGRTGCKPLACHLTAQVMLVCLVSHASVSKQPAMLVCGNVKQPSLSFLSSVVGAFSGRKSNWAFQSQDEMLRIFRIGLVYQLVVADACAQWRQRSLLCHNLAH